MKQKDIKNSYLEIFGVLVMVLALVRCAFDGGQWITEANQDISGINQEVIINSVDSIVPPLTVRKQRVLDNGDIVHRIRSVVSFHVAFPDTNATQLAAARKWGVTPVADREDAEKRKSELVYIGASPYYHVDPLTQSIPYLVPRAAILLQDIGEAFYDSLYVKGIPLHRFIVTSVLRTQADVRKLRRFNGNATENSCHLFGTTVDICYNRYETVEDPDGPPARPVRSDSLKYVLSEVLRDMRQNGRCYIKYEVKQGCFHLTVR